MKLKKNGNGNVQIDQPRIRRIEQPETRRFDHQHFVWQLRPLGTYSKSINELAAQANRTATEHLFHEKEPEDGTCIALMHSEFSEALEALRNGNPPDKHCPEFSSLEIELADCIIRILDYAGQKGLDIGGAILEKMQYNCTRPYRHGKKF